MVKAWVCTHLGNPLRYRLRLVTVAGQAEVPTKFVQRYPILIITAPDDNTVCGS
jgi:hypothetical protein